MATDPEPATPAARGPGCLAVGALFTVTAIVGWLLAITFYGLVVEQWEMIRVRREFSYDWVFLYAPLFAIGSGWRSPSGRRGVSRRRG
ncbi:hypothetical protein [Sphingopyxis panaciterrae]